MSLDLAWNDLNADAVEALVKGLVGVKGKHSHYAVIVMVSFRMRSSGRSKIFVHINHLLTMCITVLPAAAPEFEAESYDPASLLPTRTCALESLNLKGNQIGDDGVEWLAYMLRKSPTQAPSAPSLRNLGLCQCAVEARGASYLQAQLSNGQLTSLNLNDNDVAAGTHTLALAAAAARLPDFGGLNLKAVADSIETAMATAAAGDPSTASSAAPPVVLVAGKDAMAHGALALLEVVRAFTPQAKGLRSTTSVAADKDSNSTTPQPNPLVTEGGKTGSTNAASSSTASAAAGAVVPVVLDLRGSRMCGFYAEHTWAVDALVAILEAQQAALTSTGGGINTANGDLSPSKEVQVAKGETPPVVADAEAGVDVSVTGQGSCSGETALPGGNVRVVIQTIELDEGCGLVPNQLQAVFDACDSTALNVDGKAYVPPRGLCSIQ